MYTIIAKRINLDNYVSEYYIGYDNEATDNPDNYIEFKTKKAAENWTKSKDAKEWKNCEFEIIKLEK